MDVNPKDEFPIYPIAELLGSNKNNSLNARIFGSAHFAVEHPKSVINVNRPRIFCSCDMFAILLSQVCVPLCPIYAIRTAPLSIEFANCA